MGQNARIFFFFLKWAFFSFSPLSRQYRIPCINCIRSTVTDLDLWQFKPHTWATSTKPMKNMTICTKILKSFIHSFDFYSEIVHPLIFIFLHINFHFLFLKKYIENNA